MTRKTMHGFTISSAVLGVLLLAGCASDGTGPVAGGTNCAALKQQLNKLDAKGVPAYVEAQSRGKKLSPANKAEADTYNRVLNEYLGNRCHV
jgi:outer membrane murein-binding lipoprotein Lpp